MSGPAFLERFRAVPPATPEPDATPAPSAPPSFLAAFAAPAPETQVELEAPAPEPTPVVEAAPTSEPAPSEPAPQATHPNNKKVKRSRRTGLPSAAAPWNPKYRKPEPTLAEKTLETIRQMGTTPEGVAELMKWLTAEKCRYSFAEFFRQAWHVIEPSTELVWNWHLQLMCNVLQAVFMDWLRTRSEKDYINICRHLILNVPPRASKPVHVDGLVVERHRGLIRVGDVVKGDELLTHLGRHRRVTAVHEQGVLPTLTITTGRGHRVRVAHDHGMLTQRGWVRADEVWLFDCLVEVEEGGAQILDQVVSVGPSDDGECRCFTIKEDESFVYQGVAVHNSTCVSVCFQAWAWLHAPGMRFICLSVNDDATYRDALAMRNLVRSPWYVDTFRIKWDMRTDQDAKGNYANTEGGNRISMASRSEIVGLGAECVAGEALIATEWGDVQIETLHQWSEAGLELPRVWALNHATDELELRRIEATAYKGCRPVVSVLFESRKLLECTDDHEIWTIEEGYRQAARVAGYRVPYMRKTLMETVREDQALSRMRLDYSNLYKVRCCDAPSNIGDREETTSWDYDSSHVRRMSAPRTSENCPRAAMRMVPQGLQAILQSGEPAMLLTRMQPVVPAGDFGLPETDGGYRLPDLWNYDTPEKFSTTLLQSDVLQQSTLDPDDRNRQLQLLRSTGETLRRRSLVEPADTHPRTRRGYLPGVCKHYRSKGTTCPSRGPQSEQQRSGEPDHSLRQLSHEAPQIECVAVRVDDAELERHCRRSQRVYDIQVEGLHNFFAGSVHGFINVKNCILLDDPNNPRKAESRLERDEVNALWDTNQYNRVNNNVTSLRIGVQQRTHEDDWTGHAIARQGLWRPDNRDGWLQVVIPGEFDPERRFSMPEPLRAILRQYLPPEQHIFEDPRTKPGEPIDNVRMPQSWLDSERERWRGTNNYAGQILQRPVSATGGKVQRQWWGWFRLAGGVRDHFDGLELGRPRPALCHDGDAQVVHAKVQSPGNWDFDWVTISVDPAAKRTEKGSNYGLLVVAGKGGRRYVLDDRTQKGAFHEILDVLKEMILFWQPDSILIEAKAAGPDIMDTLREQMAAGDLPMVVIEEAEPGNSDKEMRLEAALPYIKNGMVYLLDGATWLEDFVDELSLFPQGSRDDRVDALSQVLNHIRADDDYWPGL